jgi:hypothetical protein
MAARGAGPRCRGRNRGFDQRGVADIQASTVAVNDPVQRDACQRFGVPEQTTGDLPRQQADRVYANEQLYVRSMSDLAARPITGTQPGLTSPVFSPDSRSIAFTSARTVKRIQVDGGTPSTVATLGAPLRGMSWHDDTLLLGQGESGTWRVSANGGTPEQIIAVGADETAESPQLLPDGRWVAYTSREPSTVGLRGGTGRLTVSSSRFPRQAQNSGGVTASFPVWLEELKQRVPAR